MKNFDEFINEEKVDTFLKGLENVINSSRDLKGYTVIAEYMSYENADEMSKSINKKVFAGYTIRFKGNDRESIHTYAENITHIADFMYKDFKIYCFYLFFSLIALAFVLFDTPLLSLSKSICHLFVF